MDIRYPVVLEPEVGGGFFVRFPDFEDVFTEGSTRDEALCNAVEALSGMLAFKLENGHAIPRPEVVPLETDAVAPDAKVQAALLVRFARGARSLAEVARALGTSWPSARRLEDPTHWPSLKSLDRVAAVMGKKLVLSFE